MLESWDNIELIVFDMDGTLTKSKSKLDAKMKKILNKLLCVKKVAIISGGIFEQFDNQLIKYLDKANLKNLYILPTSGSKFYKFSENKWKKIFDKSIPNKSRVKIIKILDQAVSDCGFKEKKVFGKTIEDRGSQITFSALGQEAPILKKEKWDNNQSKRKKIVKKIKPQLNIDFNITIGGTTSIDITLKDIDKAFGIEELSKISHTKIENMIFIGDKLKKGGNDFPVKKTGIKTIEVRDENHTRQLLNKFLNLKYEK
ncbi:MAG: HAD-IIB family hydrolase [Candidatus Paceibacterota bacterium]